jgi:dynactin complex subunit
MMYNKYYSMPWAKILMASFGYCKHKLKNFKICTTTFLNSKFILSQINFDSIVRWGGLDKINVHRIYNLQFSTAIGLHVYDSWNTIKQKKIEKIMQCPFIKSPSFWYGSGFFLKIGYYYAFTTKQMQKNIYFERNFIQKL